MLRNIHLEIKKLAKPVLFTIGALTLLTCILSCTLYKDYSIYFDIDAWEIGTEYLGLLFPLFVTVPVCWELYYERRDHFLVYTLPRIRKRAYLGAKWCACALSAFLILFLPYFLSALAALFATAPKEFIDPYKGYSHIFHILYIIILLSGLGLPWHGGWMNESGRAYLEVFELLELYFPSPWLATVGCAAQVLLGYWFIALLALWLGHFCGRSTSIKLLMGLFILAVFWIKLPIMQQPPFVYFTGLNHWVLLLHNLSESWRLPLTVAVTAILSLVAAWSVRQKWRWRLTFTKRSRTGLAPYYRRLLFTGRNVLIMAGAVFLAAGWSWGMGGAPEDSADWTVRLFAGHGVGMFYPVGLMALLLIEVLPLWPLGALSSQVSSERSAFLTIRLHRRKNLLSAILTSALWWLLLYGAMLLAAAFLPPMLLGLTIDWGLTLGAVGLKLLDVGLQFLLILCALCLTGQAIVGFGAVVLAHFLCVLPIPWLPVGLSSLVRLSLTQTGGAIAPLSAAILLATLCAVFLLWLFRWGVKGLFDHQGG